MKYIVVSQEEQFTCDTLEKAIKNRDWYLSGLADGDGYIGDEHHSIYLKIESKPIEECDSFAVYFGEGCIYDGYDSYEEANKALELYQAEYPEETETGIYRIIEKTEWVTKQVKSEVCDHPDFDMDECDECDGCDFCGTEYKFLGSMVTTVLFKEDTDAE